MPFTPAWARTAHRRSAQAAAAALLALPLLPAFVASSHAASTTANFNVTANVVDACAVTASNLAFGTYDPSSVVDKTGTSSVSVTCTLGTLYTVSLNNGANASGSTRRMAAGSTYLSYQLYKDALASQIFGTVANSLGASGVGTGAAVPSTIYGVIPKTQNVGSASYSDQITVTVDY